MKQDSSGKELPAEAAVEVDVFKHTLPLHVCLHETERFLGPLAECSGLDIGAPNAMMSYLLRKRGGEWHSVTYDPEQAALLTPFTGGAAAVWNGETLPYENKQFDYVVVFSGLERQANDGAFIEECHRVLKADGRLIMSVYHRKPLQMLNPVRKLLRMDAAAQGWARPGYTESQLFALLKHGFDVHQLRSYSRFNLEFTDLIRRAVCRKRPYGGKCLVALNILAHIAYQLDLLLFMLRGYRLVVSAKRRAWLPRNVPVLTDGRRITDAVLSRPDV